jgi:hypothetical protein
MLLTYHEKAFYVTRRCDGVQGVLRSAHNDALSRAIESQFLTQYWIDNLREDGTTRFYSAAVSNLSLDKQVFLENKFSEDLSSCDDIELFMKLRRKRARVIFEPRAVAYHPHPRNLRDLFDQRKWYGQGFVELNKKYPNVRFRKTSMFGTSKRYLTAPEHELFHMVKEDHRALCHGCPLELCRIVSKKLPTRQEMNSKYLRQITCLGFAAGILRERVGLDYDWTM